MPGHFDGKRYHNPTLANDCWPRPADVARMLMEGKNPWPKWVENKGIPRLNHPLGAGDVGLTFVNHATFLIQFPGLNILTDPVWSMRVSPLRWAGPRRVRKPGVEFDELPKIDLVLLSHNHYDHLDVDTLKRLNQRFSPEVLVPMGDKAMVQSIGFGKVHELDWWDCVALDSGTRITFTPSQHGSGRTLYDWNCSLWGSYFIQHAERRIYFGGDGGYSIHFADVCKRIAPPDVALLGIGAYAPQWFMQPLHMNPAEAVIALQDLNAKLGIGMHFGTFQLSTEGIDQPRRDLEEAMKNKADHERSFILLEEGETYLYKNPS